MGWSPACELPSMIQEGMIQTQGMIQEDKGKVACFHRRRDSRLKIMVKGP